MDTKAFKRSLQQSENYYRKGFGHEEEVNETMNSVYQSSLIQEIRGNNYTLSRGDITIRLAEAFGFCWGVERAIAIALEARTHFPTERIWVTNEIIHNPGVNQDLKNLQVEFIPVNNGEKDFSVVDSGNVVILPAFGATVQEMELLNNKGCKIVDTTCPWVSKVWNTVEKHKKREYTSIIHGKYKHEETIATSSFAGKYLIVLNVQEAEYVAQYILEGGDKTEFMAKFAKACSAGFDPDRDLERVGIANQTTMLKSETEEIGKLFERTMLKKFGPTELTEHFQTFNTICDATQERQDAMFNLVGEPLDLMLVIGGFNSSNTSHLQEIAEHRGIPSYWIDGPGRILPGNRIEYKTLHGEIEVKENWLPDGKIIVGITSGASTPDKSVEEAIAKILEQKTAPALV
ncbi:MULTISPECIES: 4-hydroxy-3-methylbut-2-enyl diphosphate reductase [Planktothricoides]|uniref:4-hydroxy-3-methylbut-2-enyl diphosphate reductase n=2 Tax=Planktothricoides raciborskii TaxID=132608 RepID=A0AAU8JMH6_9CYAN|nr:MULTISPECIES: 4-hydroxy-3-methylbut-2-enyl diphosphate reductase [Planktothricoides]KOR33987.1 4-hydroxy-3-methylbut-2-enyl diphosphate reductase [Planktothricoides sp. SR001]MBD2547530.1 4-hydroxy-3-methylbut-2-enyl diphosphate reductase [Planktothricoides raciborskii FACHB-1370]MBD2581565.1 4-hydroxy-3-methylbut-2-enyl diphosphate reductase [Planktothricoides raciborskii FACHB-1261]